MYSKNYIEAQVKEQFKDRLFSREELLEFYRSFDPYLKEATFSWRIFDLKRRHIIKDVKRGQYTLEIKQKFSPQPDKTTERIAKILESSFDYYYYNIWNTAWLNDFIELQITSFMTILEVDKGSVESVYFNLKDHSHFKNLFLRPDESVISTYISESVEPIIVKGMISKAPVMKVKNVTAPTIEKILVDLFCDDKLFYAFQGTQLIRLYENCLDKYIINYSRLLNYARRRKREEAIKEFLSINLNDKVKEVLE